MGQALVQLVQALCHKTGGRKFDSPLGNSFCLHSAALGSTQPLNKCVPRNFLVGKGRAAGSVNSSAILVVPNVKKGWKPNLPSPLWVSITCHGSALPFTNLIIPTGPLPSLPFQQFLPTQFAHIFTLITSTLKLEAACSTKTLVHTCKLLY
jgi:hypothetical protein